MSPHPDSLPQIYRYESAKIFEVPDSKRAFGPLWSDKLKGRRELSMMVEERNHRSDELVHTFEMCDATKIENREGTVTVWSPSHARKQALGRLRHDYLSRIDTVPSAVVLLVVCCRWCEDCFSQIDRPTLEGVQTVSIPTEITASRMAVDQLNRSVKPNTKNRATSVTVVELVHHCVVANATKVVKFCKIDLFPPCDYIKCMSEA